MPNEFKVPFFKSKRNALAIDLTLTAKHAADCANKARTISEFFRNYDVVLDCFHKLSKMNGKVSSVKGNLTAEYFRLQSEFQQHLHEAIDRSGDEIISKHKTLYKYDDLHIEKEILKFKRDIAEYSEQFGNKNSEFAREKYNFVCNSCNMGNLLEQDLNVGIDNFDDLFVPAVDAVLTSGQASVHFLQKNFQVGYARAARILDQMESAGIISSFAGSAPRKILITHGMWERCKLKANAVNAPKQSEISFNGIDGMDGHKFEYWCADLLQKNGFVNVEVTQGSGDQGVDILSEKDGIRYAIQCKCYSSDLGNKPVQEVNAGKLIYHCHVGAVMTNRFFTSGAKQAADATGVLLWDRNKLMEFMKKSCEG